MIISFSHTSSSHITILPRTQSENDKVNQIAVLNLGKTRSLEIYCQHIKNVRFLCKTYNLLYKDPVTHANTEARPNAISETLQKLIAHHQKLSAGIRTENVDGDKAPLHHYFMRYLQIIPPILPRFIHEEILSFCAPAEVREAIKNYIQPSPNVPQTHTVEHFMKMIVGLTEENCCREDALEAISLHLECKVLEGIPKEQGWFAAMEIALGLSLTTKSNPFIFQYLLQRLVLSIKTFSDSIPIVDKSLEWMQHLIEPSHTDLSKRACLESLFKYGLCNSSDEMVQDTFLKFLNSSHILEVKESLFWLVLNHHHSKRTILELLIEKAGSHIYPAKVWTLDLEGIAKEFEKTADIDDAELPDLTMLDSLVPDFQRVFDLRRKVDPHHRLTHRLRCITEVFDLEKILKFPKEIRALIFKGTSENTVNAFLVALGKGTQFEGINKIAFSNVHSQIQNESFNRAIERAITAIFKEHPTWQAQVDKWKKISPQDKLWLLKLYQLYLTGVDVPPLDSLYPEQQKKSIVTPQGPELFLAAIDDDLISETKRTEAQFPLTTRMPELLDHKGQVEEALAAIQSLDCYGQDLKSSPPVELLPNLETLILSSNGIRYPPDLKRNRKLKSLSIANNKLSVPPNLRNNPLLEELNLQDNRLTSCPIFIGNANLQLLDISSNLQLTKPPDLKPLVKLKKLFYSHISCESSPDVSCNTELVLFYMNNCGAPVPPSLIKNTKLLYLQFCSNKFTIAPDVSTNPQLKTLALRKCKLKSPPDISQNLELESLDVRENPLDEYGKSAIKKMEVTHPKLKVAHSVITLPD